MQATISLEAINQPIHTIQTQSTPPAKNKQKYSKIPVIFLSKNKTKIIQVRLDWHAQPFSFSVSQILPQSLFLVIGLFEIWEREKEKRWGRRLWKSLDKILLSFSDIKEVAEELEEKFKNKNKSLENFTHGFDVVLLYMSISGKKRRL